MDEKKNLPGGCGTGTRPRRKPARRSGAEGPPNTVLQVGVVLSNTTRPLLATQRVELVLHLVPAISVAIASNPLAPGECPAICCWLADRGYRW